MYSLEVLCSAATDSAAKGTGEIYLTKDLTKEEEIAFFLKYGTCPYMYECNESVGCDGTKEEMEQCRQVKFKPKEAEDARVKVQFT